MELPIGETEAHSKKSHKSAQMCKLAEKAERAAGRHSGGAAGQRLPTRPAWIARRWEQRKTQVEATGFSWLALESVPPRQLRCLITLNCDHMQAPEGLAGTQQFSKWKGGRVSESTGLCDWGAVSVWPFILAFLSALPPSHRYRSKPFCVSGTHLDMV